MKTMLLLPITLLSLAGCTPQESEVDKCVAEWEKANPGPDDKRDFCAPSQRDTEGNCFDNYNITKAQARASTRERCMYWANGNR